MDGIEDGEDEEAEGVVGDGKEEEEGDGGMALAKDETGDHVREGDVGGAGDGPTTMEGGELTDEESADEVDDSGTGHATKGTKDGSGGTTEGADRAAGKHGGPNFFGSEGEEEGHKEFVDEEVEAEGGRLNEGDGDFEGEERGIGVGMEVGPGEGGKCAENEEEGIGEDEVQGSFGGGKDHGRMIRSERSIINYQLSTINDQRSNDEGGTGG